MKTSLKVRVDKRRLNSASTSRLILDISSKDKEKRRIAAEQLGRLGDVKAVKALIEASGKGGGERAKHAAILALAKIGKPALGSLIYTLENGGESIFRRASAAEALGLIGGRKAVHSLLKAMKDPNIDVRLHTVVSLARLKERAAVSSFLKALSDKSGGVRVNAAAALGVLGSESAVMPLVKALKDQKWYVRQQAAKSLGLIGDGRAVKGIRSATRDARPAVAKAAREALKLLSRQK